MDTQEITDRVIDVEVIAWMLDYSGAFALHGLDVAV